MKKGLPISLNKLDMVKKFIASNFARLILGVQSDISKII